VLLLVVAIIVFAAVFLPIRVFPPISPTSGEANPPKKKGLILLVSNVQSALYAIKYHLADGPLEKVWLIPSHGEVATYFGQSSRPLAVQVKEQADELAGKQGRQLEIHIHDQGVSPADAHDTYAYVTRLFRLRPLPPNEMIADFTGGTKPMSIGMIMACLAGNRPLEYVSYYKPTDVMHGPFQIDYRRELFDLTDDGG
jgi:hypothetical protein